MKRYTSIFLFLCIIGFLAIFGSTASKAPTLPYYASYLGIPFEILGLIAASSTITGIFVNFLSGYLSDIYGRKKLLLISGFIFATAPILYFFIYDPISFMLVRGYYGLATAIFMPVSLACIADLYKYSRGFRMGLFDTSTLIGRLLAPVTAGFIIFYWGFPPVFIFCSILGFSALILIGILPEMEIKDKESTTSIIEKFSYNSTIYSARTGLYVILILGFMEAALYFGFQSIETFLPLYHPEFRELEWIPGLILSLQIIAIALFKPIGGYLSDKIGSIIVILFGLLISSISLFFLSISNNLLQILVTSVIYASGLSISIAGSKPLASEMLGSSRRGVALGMVESIKDIGQASGPIFTGFIASIYRIAIAFQYISLFLLVMMFILVASIIKLR